MNKSDLFNEDSICIFTDSSFHKTQQGKSSVGTCAPSVLAFIGDNQIYNNYNIIHNVTSQVGELHAFLMGVNSIYYLLSLVQKPMKINMFSDSLFTVQSVRGWLFNWMSNAQMKGAEYLVGSSGKVSNQDYILTIANTILATDIHINIFHTRGHMDIKKREDVATAILNFTNNNYLNNYPSEELITTICTYNNYVDQYSTLQLHNHLKAEQNIVPVEFLYNSEFNIGQYRRLVCKMKY